MITETISALSVIIMFLLERDVWCLLPVMILTVPGLLAPLGIWRDVQCLLSVMILTVPGLLAPLGVCGAPSQCPPGGQYFDKNLGQRGRYACCSELCEPPGFFQDQCSKKCPNYKKDKYGDDSPADNDNTNPSTLALYILIPVAVLLLLLLVLVVRIRRVRDRGWGGLLPRIFLQRGAPGGNAALPGDTPPPRTPAEDGDVGQNPLDDPQPEDGDVGQNLLDDPQPEDGEVRQNLLDDPQPEDGDVGQNLLDDPQQEDGEVGQNLLDDHQPEDGEVGQNLLDDPQPQERAQDAEDRFPEGESCGGNPVGGAYGGSARGGQLCQTAKTEAPPIQVEQQDQEADKIVAICRSSLPARHRP